MTSVVTRFPEHLEIVDRTDTALGVRLFLAGKMSANGLGDLRREVDDALDRRKQVILDLTEVTLVDRVSVEYLLSIKGSQVGLENTPVYLDRWLVKG